MAIFKPFGQEKVPPSFLEKEKQKMESFLKVYKGQTLKFSFADRCTNPRSPLRSVTPFSPKLFSQPTHYTRGRN